MGKKKVNLFWNKLLKDIPECLGKGLVKEFTNELGCETCRRCPVNNLCAAVLAEAISLKEVEEKTLSEIEEIVGYLGGRKK